METLVKDFDIKEHKSFDGYENYLNMSCLNDTPIYRREKYVDEVDFVLSSIVDKQDNILVESNTDGLFLESYEDPRFYNKSKFTFCLTYFDKQTTSVLGCKMGHSSIKKRNCDIYNLNKGAYEKNWQIHNRKFIYKIEPLEIYNSNNRNIVKLEKNKKWDPWIKKYGVPRLSTNTFKLRNKTYIIFHSSIKTKIIKKYCVEDPSTLYGIAGELKYFCGIMEVTKDYIPISYNRIPLFGSFDNYNKEQRKEFVNWRSRTNSTWVVDIFFPQNVEETKDCLTIHGGINDCVAVSINLEKKHLLKNIYKRDFVSLI